MTKTKSTKRALVVSALSLIVCVSMLIGSTFAWFTDSVSSTNNIIKSGNLDVELEYYDGDSWEKVTATTNVFEDDTLWEPGHTEVVYLKVSNLGSLALKYNLGINIVNEIESISVEEKTLRLSDYIMFGAIDNVDTPYADRDVARDAVTVSKALSTGYTKAGSIEAGAPAQYVALVVYMPENIGNEANYKTGEVAPQIDLGINLMATQYTSESDSFDEKYDEDAKFGGVPTARVTVLSDMPSVTTINNNTVTLDTGYVFNTTESYDAAQMNAHRYWHADFVAYFDEDVNGSDFGLAGQYDYYSPDWLAFELDGILGDVAAGTPIRMLEFAGISMNYEELCGIVEEFSCGAFAVNKNAMAGKTMTVELRLYETTKDPNATSGPANIETGEYIVIGTYSYTFDAVEAADLTELTDALNNGVGAIELAAGTYEMPAAVKNKTVTISGTKDTVIDVSNGLTYINGADVTFDGVTIKSTAGTGYNYGFADAKATVFNNCVIEGTLGLDYSCEFNNCTFNVSGNNYNLWTWGAGTATFNGCTFNCDGKAMLVYANVLDNGTTHQTVNITNCVFNDNGDDTVTGKAAIEITNTYTPVRTYDVIIKNTTVNGFAQTVPGAGDFNAAYGSVAGSNIGTNVWGNKCELPNTQINVVIDGVDVY